ncbi:hypothetical protein AB0878_49260 [Amycolatopsis sp. NPDC047767]|uniref:hypothetical protein n=1 Tax=Amycolatopsis sp. NPDC047767 TaxID=3156765 RepID=UPI0034512C2D
MDGHLWHDDELDYAASNAAQRFDLDQDRARDLVGMVSDAFEEGGDAVEDAPWDVQDADGSVPGEDFVDDVATSLGYDLS